MLRSNLQYSTVGLRAAKYHGNTVQVLKRLLSATELTAALLEWARYKAYDGLAEMLKPTDKVLQLQFWNSYCGHLPLLQKVVRRVLDLQAGTRCVESHFSVMGAVHS